MGLSSGNSLDSGSGGGSGLTSTQVQTIIKSNTPYQHLATLNADSSSTFEYTTLPSEYRTFRILFDGLHFGSNAYVRMTLFFSGSEYTGTNYFRGGMNKNATSTSDYHTQQGYWDLTHNYQVSSGGYMTGYIEFTGNDEFTRATMHGYLGYYYGSNARSNLIAGHVDANSTQTITGFKIYPDTGTMNRGAIKVYGMN